VDTTAPAGTPSTPTDAGATTTSTTLTFSWTLGTSADAESGISGYYLQVATDTAFTNLKTNAYVGNVTSYSVSGCVVGSTYYARVRARNGAGAYGSYSGTSNGIKVVPPPYAVYADTSWVKPLSGFMGSANGVSLTVNTADTTTPAVGTTCTKFTYDRTKETWAGVYCLYNGWTGPGMNLSGYTKLTFRARASVAGVKVKFGMGATSSSDTATAVLAGSPVSLPTTWTTYTISLSSANLTSINGLWYFSIASADNSAIANPVTFYIDDVKYTN
jgi:hypothetical protein